MITNHGNSKSVFSPGLNGLNLFSPILVVCLLVLFSITPVFSQAKAEGFAPLDESSLIETALPANTDDFVTLDENSFVEQLNETDPDAALTAGTESKSNTRILLWIYFLAFTSLAAILVRFRQLRYSRQIMLLASLVFFGFIRGGCPCIISALQNLVLFVLGEQVHWESVAFVLAILVLTYLFGRVWCGWVCHLGAFQEFVYNSHLRKIPFLQSKRTQKILGVTRIILFVVLIVQLVLTRKNLFIHIDPFKVAFNLSSYYTTGWILLALLLVSSLYIYRPFCRAVCPIGLMMTWVAKIPGASVLSMGNQCNGCKKCSKTCLSQAIEEEPGKRMAINNGDCIWCGTCMDDCRNHSIGFGRKPLRKKPVVIPEGLKN